MQGPFRHTLLYDGDCPLCRAAVRRLRELDPDGRLEFLAGGDPEVAQRFPQLTPDALDASLHLVGPQGQVREGAEAVEGVVALLPGFRWLGTLFSLPLVRPLARAFYRFVARNRYLLTCRDHCAG
jgi:predicted DCC family thiol-disulfide oxidoreductase YuxK